MSVHDIPAQRQAATPDAVHLGTWDHDDPRWHAARAHGVGGSEISAILGLSPFDSPYSLWAKKRGAVAPDIVTPQMEWGNYCEPSLVRWYSDKHQAATVNPGTFANISRPWMIANPDALAAGKVVEAKTSLDRYAWGPAGTDMVPPYYRCQALWYMRALGLFETADVICSIGGEAPEVWYVPYDSEDVDYMLEAAKDFLDQVDTGTEPDIDGSEHTYKTLRQMHPNIRPKSEWYMDDELADAYQQACRDEKASKAAKLEAASKILHAMGDAQYAMHGKTRIASRQAKANGAPYLVAARR